LITITSTMCLDEIDQTIGAGIMTGHFRCVQKKETIE